MKINLHNERTEINPGRLPARILLFSRMQGDKPQTKAAVIPAAALEDGLATGTELVIVPAERLRTVARLADEIARGELHNEVEQRAHFERIAHLIGASLRHTEGEEYAATTQKEERKDEAG